MVKFVSELPTARRGKPTPPDVVAIRKELDKNPGVWGLVESHEDGRVARKRGKQIGQDDTYKVSVRQNLSGGFDVFALAIVDDED